MRLFAFIIDIDIWTMERSCRVSITPSPNQIKTNNILKYTYSKISSRINSFGFRIHISIVTMGRSHQESVTPSKIRNKTNNIINCYKHHWSLSPEEVIRAKFNSYHQWNCNYQNKKANADYKKILRLRRKLCQLILFHDTHPNDVNDNDEHPKDIDNIDAKKTVISTTILQSVMMSITVIQILTTSTTTIQTTTTSKTLIQRTILIMLSYAIITNAVKVLISFKNMANLRRMLFN